MNGKMKCPLIKDYGGAGACIGENCGIYDAQHNKCSFTMISESLKEIETKIQKSQLTV
jgi:hypothetical protein